MPAQLISASLNSQSAKALKPMSKRATIPTTTILPAPAVWAPSWVSSNALPLHAMTRGDRVGEILLLCQLSARNNDRPAGRFPLAAEARERVMPHKGENEMFSHIMIGSNDIALFAAIGAQPGIENTRGRLATRTMAAVSWSPNPSMASRQRPLTSAQSAF
jgi:hypothetical protein